MNIHFQRWEEGREFYFVMVDDQAVGRLDMNIGETRYFFAEYYNTYWTELSPKEKKEIKRVALEYGALKLVTKRLTA